MRGSEFLLVNEYESAAATRTSPLPDFPVPHNVATTTAPTTFVTRRVRQKTFCGFVYVRSIRFLPCQKIMFEQTNCILRSVLSWKTCSAQVAFKGTVDRMLRFPSMWCIASNVRLVSQNLTNIRLSDRKRWFVVDAVPSCNPPLHISEAV